MACSSENDHTRTSCLCDIISSDDGSDYDELYGRLPYHGGILIKNQNGLQGQDGVQIDPTLTMFVDEHSVSTLYKALKEGPERIDAFLNSISDKFTLPIWIEHALLYAISYDNYDTVKHLLDHRDQEIGGGNLQMVRWNYRRNSSQILKECENAEFPIYLTPVILATKLHRANMIQLLQERNASDIHPITKKCTIAADKSSHLQECKEKCDICSGWRKCKAKLPVEECKRLIEIYKALSSPVYILNSCVDDPILEAFALSRKTSYLAIRDASLKADYERISKNCKKFACELLDLCRSTEEIVTLLSIKEGVTEVNSQANTDILPRIFVALTYGQKEFIAHPSCQQVIHQKWFEGLPHWVDETESSWSFRLYILLWCLLWPVACFLFMIKMSPWVDTFMERPINKCISDTISFVIFLVLLVIECLNNRADQRASDWFTITEGLIIVWILGMLARQTKMMYRRSISSRDDEGHVSLFRLIWRWYDMLLLLCFFIWLVLYIVGVTIMFLRRVEDLPRHKWVWWNLILVSEGFFSLGTLMSFLKFMSIFKTNSSFGPLLTSLKHMLNDILRFLFIFLFIILSFIVAIINLYSAIEVNNAFNMLFWALFGYGEPEVEDALLDNHNLVGNETGQIGDMTDGHMVTKLYSSILLGSYHVVAVVVLINMLIAMMARSYEVIEANEDVEWKNTRTKLRIIYFSEVGSLPPPFNILMIGKFTKWLLPYYTTRSWWCKSQSESDSSKPHTDYKMLIKKLSKRYFKSKKKTKRTSISDEEF